MQYRSWRLQLAMVVEVVKVLEMVVVVVVVGLWQRCHGYTIRSTH
jgi:hypothetical protein